MTRLMKIWLYALVGAPASLVGATDAPTPDLDPDQPINWVDTSHAYATDNAQALAEWMDEVFGDPLYDAERAESYLRLEFVNDWDQEDGNDFKIRLRGQVQLPRISNRLNLVFSGEDSQDLDEEERKQEDQIGLQYKLWFGDGSLSEVVQLSQELDTQKQKLQELEQRNKILEAQVLDLQNGLDAFEEKARNDLGMIKQGETFIQLIPEEETADGQ